MKRGDLVRLRDVHLQFKGVGVIVTAPDLRRIDGEHLFKVMWTGQRVYGMLIYEAEKNLRVISACNYENTRI